MKKLIVSLALVISTVIGYSQVISGDVGMAANATPEFSFGPVLNVQYHLKGGNYVGLGYLPDIRREKETYIARFGTNLNRRWYFNSGVGFVNDWSVVRPNGTHKTYRTYVVGVDYVFKKIEPNSPFNFFTGFDFTDEILYLKAGIKFGHEKRK